MDAQQPIPAADRPVLAFPSRVLGVFFTPGSVGDSLSSRPRWMGAMLLCVLLTTATGAVFFVLPQGKKILQEQEPKSMAAAQPTAKDADTDPIEKMWPMVVGLGIGSSVLGTPIKILLCAAVLWVVCTAILGSSIGYRHHIAVAAHGYLLLAVGGILSTALVFARGGLDSTLSLAAFAPSAATESLLYRSLAMGDFFRLWWLGATGVMSARAGRVSAATVIIVLLVLYLLVAGLTVAAQSFLPQGTLS